MRIYISFILSVRIDGSNLQVGVQVVFSGKLRVSEMGWWSDNVIGSMEVVFSVGRSCCVRKK